MSKVLIIIQREYATRVKKKSFVILTILMPFIFAALVFVPLWLASIEDNEQKTVAVSDTTGRYLPAFKNDASYRFVPVADPNNSAYYSDTTHYEAVVSITADLAKNPKGVTIYSHKEVPGGLLTYVETVLNEEVRRDKLKATGIAGLDRIIDDVQSEITVPTVKRNAQGEDSVSSTTIALTAGFAFTFLIYMFVMTYGGMVMQSVMEEKTNRIVELMVSSVKPFQLMIGKIVGIALVGFTQLLIWGVMFAAIVMVAGTVFGLSAAAPDTAAMAGPMVPGAADLATQSSSVQLYSAITNLPMAEMAVMFVLYFVGGYLLYASFFAAVGASVNEQEDSSQFMMPVIIVLVFALYAAMGSADNTNGPLAFWTSLFPLTSPVVMMVRIPFSVPLWQEVLSIALLYGTALLFIWGSARIYRVGILMYGKKPSVKEMIRWMRYK